MLQKSAQAISAAGDSFFYAIDDWLESLPMGTLPPTNKKLLIDQMEEIFNTPVFSKLNSHPQFQSFIKDIQELKKGAVA